MALVSHCLHLIGPPRLAQPAALPFIRFHRRPARRHPFENLQQRYRGLRETLYGELKSKDPELVLLEDEALGNTPGKAFGELAVLLVGYSEEEVAAFQKLLDYLEAQCVKVGTSLRTTYSSKACICPPASFLYTKCGERVAVSAYPIDLLL
jgi:hypothetical protein